MSSNIDTYFINGCGRCNLTGTPQCKVHKWDKELSKLRSIVADSELKEEIKWGVPCYTFHGKNVIMISAFKSYCALSFFKGVLLKDRHRLLEKPGENSQTVRLIRFENLSDIIENEPAILSYILEALNLEKQGKIEPLSKKVELVFIEELQAKMKESESFKKAFLSLTKGRQRAYNIFFATPKQSKTRIARIDKYTSQILDGKGLNDDYLMKRRSK